MHQESEIRDPLILGKKTYHDITREIDCIQCHEKFCLGTIQKINKLYIRK